MFPNVVTDSVGHPFTCIPCQANHRVGLKFVIASVTPCVITQRAGCHCVRVIAAIAPVCHRIPHAIYHIAICTRLYYIQCFIVWRLAGQTYRLHDTVILRITYKWSWVTPVTVTYNQGQAGRYFQLSGISGSGIGKNFGLGSGIGYICQKKIQSGIFGYWKSLSGIFGYILI